MFEERDEIELIQTLFQNRTMGVVCDIIRVCQMINCILGETQHQLNNIPKTESG